MLIVKRPFRNLGVVLTAGSVITKPAVIKHLKSRIGDGHIIEVAEHDLDKFRDYFLQKFKVDILKNIEKDAGKTEEADKQEPKGAKQEVKQEAKQRAKFVDIPEPKKIPNVKTSEVKIDESAEKGQKK
jgi:hypothetical protein